MENLRIAACMALLAISVMVPEASMAQKGTFKVLHSFGGSGDGIGPYFAGVVFDQSGNLYGTTISGGDEGGGIVYELTPQSDGTWKETILHQFPEKSTQDGSEPEGGVSLDPTGNVYGTTSLGGAHAAGTVFKLSPGNSGWTETILYNFCSVSGCTDGSGPGTAPVLDSAGNVYGDTANGYVFGTAPDVIYELSPLAGSWQESVLHTFCSETPCADGNIPGPLHFDPKGRLYGSTQTGGSYGPPECRSQGCGVVFGLLPPRSQGGDWDDVVLYSFQGQSDGIEPFGVSLDQKFLYGTTLQGGGSEGCTAGCGTVFELEPNPSGGLPVESIIHAFSSFAAGQFPLGGLVSDQAGNLYGVASFGGAACGCGVVFELERIGTTWQYEILHQFTGPDGDGPMTGLTIDSEGNLYGTTDGGGTGAGGGTVFEIVRENSRDKINLR